MCFCVGEGVLSKEIGSTSFFFPKPVINYRTERIVHSGKVIISFISPEMQCILHWSLLLNLNTFTEYPAVLADKQDV